MIINPTGAIVFYLTVTPGTIFFYYSGVDID